MTPGVLWTLLAAACAAGAAVQFASPARPRSTPSRAARLVALLAAVGRAAGRTQDAGGLGARLAAAGSPLGLRAGDVVAMRAGAALAGALAAMPLAASAPGRLGVAILVAGPGAGFAAPELWLRRRIAERRRAMERELADVLDLLRVTVEAGLPLGRALAEVGRRHRGALPRELARTATAIELGVPRAGALAALRERAPLAAVGTLVAALERSERHGAPLGPALGALAAEARAQRARSVAEHAARAAPKIQLAVALLLVPSVLALVAAAAVAALVPH